MSNFPFSDGDEEESPIVKETMLARLVRMETRMVKYQESNALQMGELMDTIADMAFTLQEMATLLAEEVEYGEGQG